MKTRIFVLGLLIMAAAIGGNFWWQSKLEKEDPVISQKTGLNELVFPGMTIKELTLHFGEPDRKSEENGSVWYFFKKTKLLETPLDVKVDEKSGIVLEYRVPDKAHD